MLKTAVQEISCQLSDSGGSKITSSCLTYIHSNVGQFNGNMGRKTEGGNGMQRLAGLHSRHFSNKGLNGALEVTEVVA